MPITINDCARCGQPPQWGWDDMGGGFADLILYCHCLLEEHMVKGVELADTSADWNKLNS